MLGMVVGVALVVFRKGLALSAGRSLDRIAGIRIVEKDHRLYEWLVAVAGMGLIVLGVMDVLASH